jgi:uncharacterized membrane protein
MKVLLREVGMSETINAGTKDKVQEYTARDKAYEEGMKLMYDLFKHTTTISTGSILILVTFLEKLFRNPQWRFLIGITFGSFILTLLSSLAMMFLVGQIIKKFGITTAAEDRFLMLNTVLVIASFLCGIVSLVMFAMKNLYS